MNKPNKLFGELFKKFRLRAGFESLTSLANALAEDGLIFDDSTLSRWQKGNRVPKKRDILIYLIKLFVNHDGVSNIEEANSFMETAGLGFLTEEEAERISGENLLLSSPFQTPLELKNFVGRRQEIKEISEKLINNKSVVITCIFGLGGVGKTALAIHLGHKLRSLFPDGILWSRMDISTPNDVLNKIALSFKENVASIENLQTKAEIIHSLLFKKKALLVFDNVKNSQQLSFLLPNSPSCSVLITSRNQNLARTIQAENFCLQPFNQEESHQLFNKITKPEALTKKEVDQISKALGYLPLALAIIANQINHSPDWRIGSILKSLKNEQQRLDQLEIDSIGVRSSFNLSFKKLNTNLKKLFSSLAVFSGEDFSIEAVAAINKTNKRTAEELLEKLISRSLIERSSVERYRLHPLMKLFAQELIQDKNFYLNAYNYYISSLSKKEKDDNYSFIEKELENILGFFSWFLKNKEYKLTLQIWEYIGVFLWDCGYWPETYRLGKRAYKASKILKDKKLQVNCCLKQLCWVCFWQNKIKEAEKFAGEGLKLAKDIKDQYLIALAKKRLGMIYKRKKEYKKALKVLRDSLKIFRKLKKENDVLDVLTYMGHVFYQQRNFKKAIFYYKKALKIANALKDKMGRSILLNSLGMTYTDLSSFELAEKYYKRNLKAAKTAKSLPAIFWCKRSFGLLEVKRRNFDKAYDLLSEAYERGRRLGLTKELVKLKKIIKKVEQKLKK